MTLEEYLALVPPWNSQQPKFMSTVAVLTAALVDAQTLLAKLVEDFSLDTAVGVQLDMVGQWIGRTRFVRIPITGTFFAFDHDGERVGFDQGVWLGPWDETSGIGALDDETYRTFLRMQAIANQWDGTLEQIHDVFDAIFPGVVIQDKGDLPGQVMTMDVLIPGPVISSLLIKVLEQDFPIKPGGVFMNIIETSVVTQPIFGFDLNTGPFGGFDSGAWGIVIHSA